MKQQASLHWLVPLIAIIAVISQTIFQALDGIIFPIGVYVGMVGSWVVMGAFAVGLATQFFGSLSDKV